MPLFVPIGGGGGGFLLFLFIFFVFIAAARIRAQRPAGTTPSAGLHLQEHLRASRTVVDAVNPVARRRRAERQRQVELAAHEAAEDDGSFAPEVVHAEAERLFRDVQDAWSRDDRDRLQQLAGSELWQEWSRRLADFAKRGWRNEVSVVGPVAVEYVGLTNREATAQDRVVVRISAQLRDVVVDSGGGQIRRKDSFGEVAAMAEYWTLAPRDGHWIVVSIEQEQEGDHELSEPIVATPWADTERLRESALAEQAATEKAPGGVAEIATPEFDDAARAAALDLSLVDGRFAPDLLAAQVSHAVEAWSQAVDADRGDLASLASPEALELLLHPGDGGARTRLVVRGPHVRSLRIVALDPQAEPPEMTIALEVRGFRYVEDRDTAEVLSGSSGTRTTFRESWRLALDGDDAHPWRIVGVTH